MKLGILIGAGLLASIPFAAANAIVVDGNLDGDYGAAKSVVVHQDSAPTSNFGAPTNTTDSIGYSIYLSDQGGTLYGYLKGDAGSPAGLFANVYFGLTGDNLNGSVFGFELGSSTSMANMFTPGASGSVQIPVQFATSGNNIEFAISNSYFEQLTPGLSNTLTASDGNSITLRLSQSFGYSVAGGDAPGTYTDHDRLGTVTLSGAVPETSTWAMMLLGFCGVGAMTYRRRKQSTALTAA